MNNNNNKTEDDIYAEKFKSILYNYCGIEAGVVPNKEKEYFLTYDNKCIGTNFQQIINIIVNGFSSKEFDLNSSIEIDNIYKEVSLDIIFEKVLVDNKEKDNKIYEFVKSLNILSNRTYELEIVNSGVIVYYGSNVEKFIEELKMQFIPIEGYDFNSVIYNEKPLWKLINNKTFIYVLDSSLGFIGFACKKRDGDYTDDSIQELINKDFIYKVKEQIKDIIDYYAEFTKKTKSDVIKNVKNVLKNIENEISNEAISKIIEYSIENYESYNLSIYEKKDIFSEFMYIKINNNRVIYSVSSMFYLEERKTGWYLNENISLILPLLNAINNDLFLLGQDNYENLVNCIIDLISILKYLSYNHIGGLIVICSQKQEKTISKLFKNNDENKFAYMHLLNKEQGKNNILTMDRKLLCDLISIDGATIFDSMMNLLYFGKILKNDEKNVNSQIYAFGARTSAAISASMYGLAIKISEDGDITLFHKGEQINKYINI